MARVINRYPTPLQREYPLPKTANTAGTRGNFVTFTSGYLTEAGSGTTFIVGLNNVDWVNDATNGLIPIDVDEMAIYEMDVANGPLVQATHVGNTYDFNDAHTINLSAQSHNVLRVVGITATGRALARIAVNW